MPEFQMHCSVLSIIITLLPDELLKAKLVVNIN